MSFIGVILLIIFAFIVWREYVSYVNRGLFRLSEFIRFIKNMRDRMECYLESPSRWVNDFSSAELEDVGFLRSVRGGTDMGVAYSECKEGLFINTEADAVLGEIFSHVGDGYLGMELASIDSAITKLLNIESSLKAERTNKVKAAGAILGALTLGIVILIL